MSGFTADEPKLNSCLLPSATSSSLADQRFLIALLTCSSCLDSPPHLLTSEMSGKSNECLSDGVGDCGESDFEPVSC